MINKGKINDWRAVNKLNEQQTLKGVEQATFNSIQVINQLKNFFKNSWKQLDLLKFYCTFAH
jgi:hypothetical protein